MTEVDAGKVRTPTGEAKAKVHGKSSTQASPSAEDKPKKRRRSSKIITEKKFECKHPGCGRQYSRAEHLYRHQLNRMPNLDSLQKDIHANKTQTTRSRSTDVTTLIAFGSLYARIYAYDIENDTPHTVRNFNAETRLPITSTAPIHPSLLLSTTSTVQHQAIRPRSTQRTISQLSLTLRGRICLMHRRSPSTVVTVTVSRISLVSSNLDLLDLPIHVTCHPLPKHVSISLTVQYRGLRVMAPLAVNLSKSRRPI